MKSRNSRLICVSIAVAVLAIGGWAFRRNGQVSLPSSAKQAVLSETSQEAAFSRPELTGSPTRDEASKRIRGLAEELSNTRSSAGAREILRKLRAYLVCLPKEVSTAAIHEFLVGGADIRTKLEFKISHGGQLSEAPSLRVWLLDSLGQIDRQAAADYARTILAGPASPDEWAVSLRDYALARTSPEDVAFVKGKLREMLHNAAWQQNPSAGYLEAFDAIVHTKATDLTLDLTQLLRKQDNRALAHAAYLTLDRLVLEKPKAVLSQLASEVDVMGGREQTRANYFARADVRDTEQRALVESYLLDPRRTPEELQAFAGIYPNANFMISNNLLTQTQTPSREELAAHDREALGVVRAWLADPRFASVRPYLQQMHDRLRQFDESSR